MDDTLKAELEARIAAVEDERAHFIAANAPMVIQYNSQLAVYDAIIAEIRRILPKASDEPV